MFIVMNKNILLETVDFNETVPSRYGHWSNDQSGVTLQYVHL